MMLESRHQVGLPIQCGEALPNYYDLKRVFPKIDCPELLELPDHVIASKVSGIHFILPKGWQFTATVNGWMIYRDRLDQYLFDEAIRAGAEARLHRRVQKIVDHRVMTTDEEFVADIIIGADGPNSVVSASFPAFEANRELAPCSFILAEGYFFEDHIEIWIDKRFPGGYFWLFPKNGEANIGVGLRGQCNVRNLLKNMVEELLKKKKFRIKMHGGGIMPIGGLKKRVAWEHVGLVGDAAEWCCPALVGEPHRR